MSHITFQSNSLPHKGDPGNLKMRGKAVKSPLRAAGGTTVDSFAH